VRHDGWQLQKQEAGDWVTLDQSVVGNDYWQARYDGATDRYTLTYNVMNRGTNAYRLIWSP
jgi:hypothetical protein